MSTSESIRSAPRAHEPTTTTPRTSPRLAAQPVTMATTDRTSRVRSWVTTRPSLSRPVIDCGTASEAARDVHGVKAAPGSPAIVLVVWTDDVDEAYKDLLAAGVPSIQPPHDTGNSNRNALLRDPDGNLVEIVSKIS